MILVTGFDYHDSINASGVLVRSLKDKITQALEPIKDTLVFEVITCDETFRETEHVTLESQLRDLLVRHAPTICIHTGQAPPYNKITIEKIAINSFRNEIIDPSRPAAYWSDLPGADGLRSMLEQQGIPACYSFYCGQHTCNHILYSSLHFSTSEEHRHRAGFVHLPVLPEQVITQYRDSPHMTLGTSRKALSLIISHVASAYEDNNRSI